MKQRVVLAAGALVAAAAVAGGSIAAWEIAEGEDGTAAAVAQTADSRAAADRAVSVAEIYRSARSGVVEITVGGGDPRGAGTGSGFVVDEEGRIVTNYHVVEGANTVTVTFVDGEEAEARVVGGDPSTDVAVLELVDPETVDVEPLELGSADSLEVGDLVVAIGSPYGLEGTLTTGVVSALDREIRAPDGFTIPGAIQTDAAINQGSSGGPLLDDRGRVVGVTTQIQSQTGGNVGIGYAVPIETAREVVEQLLEDGSVAHAYLGVTVGDTEDGALIETVVDDGPAHQAGLEEGDVVTEVGGEPIDSGDALAAAVASREPGDTLALEIRRGDDTRTVEVELGERPARVE